MKYKYSTVDNYEDFASGRVLYHKTNSPSFPVRLGNEIFRRCLEYTGKSSDITLFDPCCGGAYMLTVLGLLNSEVITKIIGSDVDEQSLSLARSNLSLLTKEGLHKRTQHIMKMIEQYNKQSHIDALRSTEKFLKIVEQQSVSPEIHCFVADALDDEIFRNSQIKADIVIADVPYGNLVSWSGSNDNAINRLLDSIYYVLNNKSVVAICSTKKQIIQNDKYKRIERFKVGKRLIQILKLV